MEYEFTNPNHSNSSTNEHNMKHGQKKGSLLSDTTSTITSKNQFKNFDDISIRGFFPLFLIFPYIIPLRNEE